MKLCAWLPEYDLSEDEEALLQSGMVLIAAPSDAIIPEEYRARIQRGFAGSGGMVGMAATLQCSDGTVIMVFGKDLPASVVRHELIHVCQCFASPESMAAAFAAAVRIGRDLVNAVDEKVATEPGAAHGHRDVERIQKAWQVAAATDFKEGFVLFETLQAYYPSEETAQLAAGRGAKDADGVYAAIVAHVATEAGFEIDPECDLAREIVAYAFQDGHDPCITELFRSAVEQMQPSESPAV